MESCEARPADYPFVSGFARQLEAMQREWMRTAGLDEVPPVALLADPAVGVKVFAWPSPWLH